MGQSTAPRPAAGGIEGAEVGPLGEVGLAEDDGSTGAQFRSDRRVADGGLPSQRERARGGLHPVACVDVVLQQHRDAVQRSQQLASGAQVIGVLRHRQGVRVDLQDGIDAGPVLVQRLDAVEVETRELDGSERASRHLRLQLRHGGLVEFRGLRHRGCRGEREECGDECACHDVPSGVGKADAAMSGFIRGHTCGGDVRGPGRPLGPPPRCLVYVEADTTPLARGVSISETGRGCLAFPGGRGPSGHQLLILPDGRLQVIIAPPARPEH